MPSRIGGNRRKTRHMLRKHVRSKGKLSLTKYFQTFNDGENVILSAEPSIQKGMYFTRFYGLRGQVKEKVGSCYKINIKDGNKDKTVIVHPVHLKKVQ